MPHVCITKVLEVLENIPTSLTESVPLLSLWASTVAGAFLHSEWQVLGMRISSFLNLQVSPTHTHTCIHLWVPAQTFPPPPHTEKCCSSDDQIPLHGTQQIKCCLLIR